MSKCGIKHCDLHPDMDRHPRFCASHWALKDQQRAAYDALPECARCDAKVAGSDIMCKECRRVSDETEANFNLETALDDCHDVDDLKEFIRTYILEGRI
jgi:hypothetical protein